MTKQIYPYQYHYIAEQMYQLHNIYKSVNDPETVKHQMADVLHNIRNVFEAVTPELEASLETLKDIKLSKYQIEKVLNVVSQYVIPFQMPSSKQIEKQFRKVKKLKVPNFSSEDLLASTFLGWNDPSSNRRYMLYYDESD